MTDRFLTPDQQQLLRRLQTYCGILGVLLLLIGIARIAAQVMGWSNLGELFSPALFSTATLGIGILYALVGYGAIYTVAAIGATEPPALTAIQYSLVGFVLVFIFTLLWGIMTGIPYAVLGLGLTLASGGIGWQLWGQVEKQALWQTFGQKIDRSYGTTPLNYLVAGGMVLLLLSLGIIYAILSNTIELPLREPDQGQLLYLTTFDDFNDEWDLPKGRQSAEIQDEQLVLTEATGLGETGFYARLDSRQFSDFDLRLRTHQMSGDDDNTYGIIFRWRDFDNYYQFEISGDGYYRLSKVQDGRAENLTQWIPSDLIHVGTAQNEIGVVANGDTFRFYINNQLAQLCTKGSNREPLVNPLTGECVSNTWQDEYTDANFRQGKIAVSVGTTATTDITQPIVIGFDNLIMVGP